MSSAQDTLLAAAKAVVESQYAPTLNIPVGKLSLVRKETLDALDRALRAVKAEAKQKEEAKP